MTPDHVQSRLALAIDQRRVELRLKWNQLAQRAGLSVASIGRIRRGEGTLTELAKSSLESALEWPRGHIDQLLAMFMTGDSTEAEREPEPVNVLEMGAEMLAAVRQLVNQELADRDQRIADRIAELEAEVERLKERPDDGDSRSRHAS